MKFNLENPNVIFSHLVLQDHKAASAVAETEQWVEDEVLEAEVKINGVIIPAEIFEKWMQDQYTIMEEEFKVRYDSEKFDARVEEKARELLNEHAEGVMDAMRVLQDNLKYNHRLFPHN